MDLDDFSDHDLDDLNANALQELENNAIQFTQAQKTFERPKPPVPPKTLPPPPRGQPPRRPAYGTEDDDLDDTEVVVQDALQPPRVVAPVASAQLPSRGQPQQQRQSGRQQHHQQHQRQQQQNGTWRPVSVHHPAGRLGPRPPTGPTSVGPRASQHLPSRNQGPSLPRPAPSVSSASQAPRQTAPPSDRAELEEQLQVLEHRVATQDGENSILRKQLKAMQAEHERQLRLITARSAEDVAKKQRALEAAIAARQSVTTELEFLKRDQREDAVRAKRQDGPSTPKKNAVVKAWGVSDGFEDVEVAASPSKGKRGKNAGPVAGAVVEPPSKLLRTPTKSKRKRPLVDSPVTALETHSEDVVMMDDVGIPAHDVAAVSQMAPVLQNNAPFDFLKVILNHRSAHGLPLTFEYLARFELLSRPSESLASILLRKLSTAGDPGDPTQLPIQFCLEVIRLWDACRAEGLLDPTTELVSLVSFTMQLHPVTLAPYIAPSLIPVAMDSCYLLAIPRFNNLVPGEPTADEFIRLRDNTDTHRMLSLLYLTALGCATATPEPTAAGMMTPIVDFWSLVHMHFVLVHLSRKQPIDDFIAVLRLLCTSVFPESIGPIDTDKPPPVVARLLIDRVSLYMTDRSRWDADETRLWDLRLASLQTLSAFARSPFGLAHLAQHHQMIPRLVMLLSHCIEQLYDGDMQYHPPSAAGAGDGATDGLQRTVAHAMFLLHMIVMSPGDGSALDVSAKLAKTTGGSQRYLLSLSRLNFADDLVSEDTAELAHELLELAVTSEAGEELGEFFSG